MTNRLGFVMSLATAWLFAADGLGFGGSVVELPLQRSKPNAPVRFSPTSGFSVSVDTRWFDAGGYRPVRVRFDRQTAATSDRRLSIEVTLQRSGGADGQVVVSKEIDFPAGETTAETVVLCPADELWDAATWTLRVNGSVEPQLSLEPSKRQGGVSLAASQPLQGLRIVRPFVEDETSGRQIKSRRQERLHYYGRRQVGADILDSEPIEDWLGYSSADVLLLDIDDLRDLAAKRPDRQRVVRRWLLSGGNVWVESVNGSVEGYDEIDQLLNVASWRYETLESEREAEEDPPDAATPPKAEAIPEEPTGDTVATGGEPDDKKRDDRLRFVPIEGANGWGYQELGAPDNPSELAEALAEDPVKAVLSQLNSARVSTEGWYATRRVGFGRVLAFDKTYASVPQRMRFGQSEMIRALWLERAWPQRHGVEPGGSSPQFGNLLIPDVGVAPVTEFQFLITLFVLTIGPLNYWLLWRRQQLQMLVVTVPLCALAVTLGLVGYAAVADGFGVKARVRSVTLLNQVDGEAASWSRVSHYAAMAPDTPPVLPADCAIYPINPAWEAALSPASEGRRLEWTEAGQRLTSGWIPSRTAAQHLIVRSRESPAKLVFAKQGGQVRVSNQLGAAIQLLLVRDVEGAWTKSVEVAAGETASLEPLSRMEAVQAYRVLALQNEPEFPIGAGKAVEQTLERLGNARTVRRMQRGFANVSVDDNLAEQVLDSVSGLAGGRSLDLPPRSYVAVTRESVETPLGWDEVEEVGSFHVVVGRW